MKTLLGTLMVLGSLNSFASLSRDCEQTLDNAVYSSKEHKKTAIQFNNSNSLILAQRVLDNGAKYCIEMALSKRNYSDKRKVKIAKKVFAEANSYLAGRGYHLTAKEE